jgi:hypothetical protein
MPASPVIGLHEAILVKPDQWPPPPARRYVRGWSCLTEMRKAELREPGGDDRARRLAPLSASEVQQVAGIPPLLAAAPPRSRRRRPDHAQPLLLNDVRRQHCPSKYGLATTCGGVEKGRAWLVETGLGDEAGSSLAPDRFTARVSVCQSASHHFRMLKLTKMHKSMRPTRPK